MKFLLPILVMALSVAVMANEDAQFTKAQDAALERALPEIVKSCLPHAGRACGLSRAEATELREILPKLAEGPLRLETNEAATASFAEHATATLARRVADLSPSTPHPLELARKVCKDVSFYKDEYPFPSGTEHLTSWMISKGKLSHHSLIYETSEGSRDLDGEVFEPLGCEPKTWTVSFDELVSDSAVKAARGEIEWTCEGRSFKGRLQLLIKDGAVKASLIEASL